MKPKLSALIGDFKKEQIKVKTPKTMGEAPATQARKKSLVVVQEKRTITTVNPGQGYYYQTFTMYDQDRVAIEKVMGQLTLNGRRCNASQAVRAAIRSVANGTRIEQEYDKFKDEDLRTKKNKKKNG